jgi:hypothetical protein
MVNNRQVNINFKFFDNCPSKLRNKSDFRKSLEEDNVNSLVVTYINRYRHKGRKVKS